MKLIKIEELISGDEIIISGNSKLKYLKVLSTPVLGNKDLYQSVVDNTTNSGWNWKVVGKKYKSIRCSTRQDEIPYKNRAGFQRIYKKYVFEQDVSKHNKKVNIDLNGRDIYLVKREEIKKEQIF
mgnify:CR=1 FL=1